MKQIQFLHRIYNFYRSGFQQMRVGKVLWKIIVVKLFIMFVILKLFFFPDFLGENFATDKERADHVAEQFTDLVKQEDK